MKTVFSYVVFALDAAKSPYRNVAKGYVYATTQQEARDLVILENSASLEDLDNGFKIYLSPLTIS